MGDFPARIHLGAGTLLVSVDHLAYAFGVSLEDVRSLLGVLELPVVNLPGNPNQYVNQYALELLLFKAGLPKVMQGDAHLCQNLLDHAGTIYGAVKREIIRDRLRRIGLGRLKPGARGPDKAVRNRKGEGQKYDPPCRARARSRKASEKEAAKNA